MIRWQWHQLDHMQIICTLLQTDASTSLLNFFTDRMLYHMPTQQWPSTEGNKQYMRVSVKLLLRGT